MIDKIVEFGYQGGFALDNALVFIPLLFLFISGLLECGNSLIWSISKLTLEKILLGCIACVALCIFVGVFVNHVNDHEFAIYIDSNGQAVLQAPGSGYHFGRHEAYYFSVKEKEVCKDGMIDFLGNIKVSDAQCEYKSITPSEFVKNVRSLKAFSNDNASGKYNRDFLLVEVMRESPPPAYINVRYAKPSYK